MTDKQRIIEGVDISKCKHYDEVFNYCDQSYLGEGGLLKNTKNPKRCECSPNCYYKQLKRKEQECEELKRSIIKIFVFLIKANRRGKIIDTLWVDDITTLWDYIALTLGIEGDQTQIEKQIRTNPLITEEEPANKYKQVLNEIIRFFKEDEKFARYSGRPIIFAKPALEKIEKILKENDIKIS